MNQQIANVSKRLEERTSGERTSDKAKALAADTRDKGQIKTLQFKLKQEFVNLGKAAFAAEGAKSGPVEMVNHITEFQDRHTKLTDEIDSLNSQGSSSMFSPKQFAVGVFVVLGLTVSLFAYSMFAGGNGNSDVQGNGEIASKDADDDQNPGVGSQQPTSKPSKGEFKEISNNKKFSGQTPASPFDEIIEAEIPFELQTPDIPKEVVKLYPATAKVLSGGRFVSYTKGAYAYLDDLKEGTSTRLEGRAAKSVSPSGKYVYGVGSDSLSLREVTPRGLKKILEFHPDGGQVTFEGIPRIHNDSAVNDLGGFSPKETFFIATDSYNWGRYDPADILLVSIAQRRVVQKFSNVIPPLRFSDDERRVYCRNTQGYLMMYEWDGKQFTGKQKWDADLYHYHAANDLFFSATAMGKDGTNQWGFGVWDYAKNDPELIRSKPLGLKMCGGPVGGGLISYEKNQETFKIVPSNPFRMSGHRVAWFTLECDESDNFQKRWLYYADIKEGLIKKYPLPFGVDHGLEYVKPIGTELIGLDYSGRYAFLTKLVKGEIAVYRLESR
ncbi:hypothetical protein [Thalassoglobus polymorphus]|uniref:hypothetical protein n=1 Tax=Thalassoglobus polymorphus TaxID=2527994 RepID=UPI0011A52DBF|nr:hypothetical protein [Thalassoglobus polymorphus]